MSRTTWPDGSNIRRATCARRRIITDQGKIERWHPALENRILLDNYYLPDDLERQVGAFVQHYNHQRYHEPSTI